MGKLLCKSIVERQMSCAKACAWFLQNHSDSSGKKFSYEKKIASQDKTKKTFTTQNETMLLKVPVPDIYTSNR